MASPSIGCPAPCASTRVWRASAGPVISSSIQPTSDMCRCQLPGVQPPHYRRPAACQQPHLGGIFARRVDALGHALAAVDVYLQQRPVQEQAQLQGLTPRPG